jgi:DNA-binding transcriptional MerR regulator
MNLCNVQFHTMPDVVRETGVPYWRLYYAELNGCLPEPKRIGRNRVYTDTDLRRIREYFENKEGACDEDAVRQA